MSCHDVSKNIEIVFWKIGLKYSGYQNRMTMQEDHNVINVLFYGYLQRYNRLIRTHATHSHVPMEQHVSTKKTTQASFAHVRHNMEVLFVERLLVRMSPMNEPRSHMINNQILSLRFLKVSCKLTISTAKKSQTL